jgi:integral membrane protein (TIGR01906 family)
VALWLIAVSFRLLLLPPATSLLAERTVNDQLSALDHAQLVEVAERGRAFVMGAEGATLPAGDDGRIAFPSDVVGHMQDVRDVLQAVRLAVAALTLLLLAVVLYVWRRAGRKALGLGLLAGAVAAVAVTLLLVALGALNFSALFTAMHQLFFAEGTWVFAEDSLLICAYPLGFWIGMGATWALMLLLASALVALLGIVLRRR